MTKDLSAEQRTEHLENIKVLRKVRFIAGLLIWLIFTAAYLSKAFTFPLLLFSIAPFSEMFLNQPYEFITKRVRRLDILIEINLVLDLFFITWGTHQLGELDLLFATPVYALPIIYAGIVLSGSAAYYLSAVALFLYGGLILLEFYQIVPDVSSSVELNLPGSVLLIVFMFAGVSLFLISLFTDYLAKILRKHKNNLQRITQNLQESEERYRIIFEQAPDAVVLLDPQTGKLPVFNDKAHQNLGYTREEFKDLTIPDFEIVESSEQVRKHIEKVLRQGGDTFETKHKRKDGQIRNILVSSRVITIRGKGFIQNIFSDITERKKSEQDLRKAYELLKQTQTQLIQAEKLAVIGRLASGMAHEINNPLFVISGEAQMLAKEKSKDKDIRDSSKIIIEQAKRIQGIIERLLEFSHKRELEQAPVNINNVLNESLKVMHYQIKTKNIRLIKKLDANLPQIAGDTNQLQEVCLNVMVNAVQAMGKRGTLTLRSYKEKVSNLVVVEFQDTGPGIGKQDLDKLFEPFFTTKAKGTGLGLPICRQIIKAHGGTIEVHSRPGKGSNFIVKLPILEKGAG